MQIDLNCDIGESGFEVERRGPTKTASGNQSSALSDRRSGIDLTSSEEALLGVVTSVNIACGYHAGDHNSMAAIARAAVSRKISVGAHPSLADREGFGRREMTVSPIEIYNLVLYQIGALSAFARAAGTVVGHVKPHGALYHMAENDPEVAEAIVSAVRDALPGAAIVGQSGGALVAKALHMKLRAANEVFADRAYRPDGSLQPRVRPNAVITDPRRAAERIAGLLQTGAIEAIDGSMLTMSADTVCVHGDSPRAPEFARILAATLAESGVILKSLAR